MCDALIHNGLTGLHSMASFLADRHDHGIVRARTTFPFLDGRAESIPESELRVELACAGLYPTPQIEVHDGLGFVARVDLAFEEHKVAVEYDGAWHGDPVQLQHDRARLRRLRACGWMVITVTSSGLYRDTQATIDEIRRAVESRCR